MTGNSLFGLALTRLPTSVPDCGLPSSLQTGSPGCAKPSERYRDTLLPNPVGGIKAADRAEHAIDHMIEMKVPFDTDPARAR